MNTINLFTNTSDLKKYLHVDFFFGERFFTPNTKVKVGELVPVYLLNETKKNYYLHNMRWGIDLFDGGNAVGFARFENILKNDKWKELVKAQQTCIMILKGYYYHDHRSIFNSKNGTMQRKNDMYYVHSDAKYLCVAALFQKKMTYKGIQYGVVALTSDSTKKEICNRVLLALNGDNIQQWLYNGKINLETNKQFNLKFKEIGFWVQDKDENDESIILQSKQQWIMDQEAKNIGFEEHDFPWDIMEQTALDAIKIKKENINSYSNIEDDLMQEVDKDDFEAKDPSIDDDSQRQNDENNIEMMQQNNEAQVRIYDNAVEE